MIAACEDHSSDVSAHSAADPLSLRSPQYTYEGAVPYEKTGDCLIAMEEWLTKELHDPQGLRSHFPIEIRWTEKDDIWLSPTYGQRASYIGAIQYR
jgi:L-gulonolactone oxidase